MAVGRKVVAILPWSARAPWIRLDVNFCTGPEKPAWERCWLRMLL